MTYLIFISITGLVGVTGAIFFAKNNTWRPGRILLPVLSVLLLVVSFTEYLAAFTPSIEVQSIWLRISFSLHFFIALLLLELTVSFLGKNGISKSIAVSSKIIPLHIVWRAAAVILSIASFFLPWFVFIRDGVAVFVLLTGFGEVFFALLFCYYLLSLYAVEKIFRNIPVVQKRFFFWFLSCIGILALGSMVLLVRMLFFKIVSFDTIQLHAALCGIFFPGIIIGLTRYRLWQEQIVIGRGIVYTSFTILFFGIFLVLLGSIASAVKFLGLRFDEFEEFVILFSFLFIGIFVFFSPHMRKTITALSKKYIYKAKFDYRDQLFRFHTAHQASSNVHQTIKAFIDNLHYTIIVKKAYVFLTSGNENKFVLFDDAVPAASKTVLFRGSSLLVRLLENGKRLSIDINHENDEATRTAILEEKPLLDKLNISHLFALRYRDTLEGILGIDTGSRIFDSEDLMLISMFCESIGAAIHRDRIQSEYIEQKQFESFNHMASFIIHDIKNQVATLTLVTKNARANIGNTDFHPTLLRSLENCSVNLNLLIEKLKAPPHKDHLVCNLSDCNEIVKKSVEQMRDTLPERIVIHFTPNPVPSITIDASALFFVLKNLMINAVEAFGNKEGTIRCATCIAASLTGDDTESFYLNSTSCQVHNVCITVEDNGPGMSRDFLENMLFKPFSTTKDKGIGLGLYQCKTLIESMGGRLLCHSVEGKGTRFCILL